MTIPLTDENAAYTLPATPDTMVFRRNLETRLAKRSLGRHARDLAVFLGA
jgi:hypothetical protein